MTAAFIAFLFLAVLVGALAGFGAGCLAARVIRRGGCDVGLSVPCSQVACIARARTGNEVSG